MVLIPSPEVQKRFVMDCHTGMHGDRSTLQFRAQCHLPHPLEVVSSHGEISVRGLLVRRGYKPWECS